MKWVLASWLLVASVVSGQLAPPPDAYVWSGATGTGDATDPDNWHAPEGGTDLPTEGAHLVFSAESTSEDTPIIGLELIASGEGFGSLWLESGAEYDGRRTLSSAYPDAESYTPLRLGVGTTALDRLLVARGEGNYTLDTYIFIHGDPNLPFRIQNDLFDDYHQWGLELIFKRGLLLAADTTLIVDGRGDTSIEYLYGDGSALQLIKEGSGTLAVTDGALYKGTIHIRDGIFSADKLSTDASITLAGGLLDLPKSWGEEQGRGWSKWYHHELTLGAGPGQIRWETDKSGGFTSGYLHPFHLALDGGRTLTWGEEHFVSLGSELLFKGIDHAAAFKWYNGLDLGNPLDTSVRTIRFLEDEHYTPFVSFTKGIVAQAGQTLRIAGTGTFGVVAANDGFFGNIELEGAVLAFYESNKDEEDAHLRQAQTISVSQGGKLAIEIFEEDYRPLSDTVNISLSSGTLEWRDWSHDDYWYDWSEGSPDYDTLTRRIGAVRIGTGASQILRPYATNLLRAQSLQRDDARATLLVDISTVRYEDTVYPGRFPVAAFDNIDAIKNTVVEGIMPWLVVNAQIYEYDARVDWGIFPDGSGKLVSMTVHDTDGETPWNAAYNYYTGSETTWEAGHNVDTETNDSAPLTADRTINSLRGEVNLAGHTLTISSGGLILEGGDRIRDDDKDMRWSNIWDDSNDEDDYESRQEYENAKAAFIEAHYHEGITTAGGRPLYIHTHIHGGYGDDSAIEASIKGGMDLVKTGERTLVLRQGDAGHSGIPNHVYAHDVGSVYIHQGTLHLNGVTMTASGRFTVGDGGSDAALRLTTTEHYRREYIKVYGEGPDEDGDYWYKGEDEDDGYFSDEPSKWEERVTRTPINRLLLGKRDLRLRGNDHGKTARLILEGNHDLRLTHLSIEGSTVLEFKTWDKEEPNNIFTERLHFENATSRLVIERWEKGDEGWGSGNTHLVVRKTSPDLDAYLSQIWFADYGAAKKIVWDADYWEIVPYEFNTVPEPSTYGAILGAAGLVLASWHRRKRRKAREGRPERRPPHSGL